MGYGRNTLNFDLSQLVSACCTNSGTGVLLQIPIKRYGLLCSSHQHKQQDPTHAHTIRAAKLHHKPVQCTSIVAYRRGTQVKSLLHYHIITIGINVYMYMYSNSA